MTKTFFNKALLFLVFSGASFFGFSQSSIPQLQDSLSKTTSTKKKADICFTISVLYSNKLKIDSALFFANKVKEFSQESGYETGLGKSYFALGLAFLYRSKNEAAEENTLKAIEIFTQQKETILIGRAYMQMGQIQYRFNIVLSRQNYWTAIHYLISSGDNNGCFRAYYLLARTYHKSSEIDSVAFYYVKALAIAEQAGNAQQIFESACELGKSFLNLRDFKKAFKYLDYGLKNRMPTSDRVLVRFFLRDYTTCLILMHDFTMADSAIKEFELMNVKLGDQWGKISLNKIKGVLEYERKNYSQALYYLKQAYGKQDELRTFDREIKEIGFLLGKTEYETHDYDSAVMHLQLVAQWSHEWGELTDEKDAYLLISRSFEKKDKPDSALHYFQSYSLLKDSILSIQKQKTIIEITTGYETSKKEQEIKILQKEGEANNYLLQLNTQQLQKQELESQQKSNQLILVSKQNEISKLDASQKTLGLDNERKENEKNQAKLRLLEKESALQTAIAGNQKQRKNFAYGLIASILIFSGYGYYRYRQNKKLSRQLSHSLAELKQAQTQLIKSEKEKESENIRVHISRDIHDEVGATLSGVALFSEIAKQKMEQHNEVDAKIYLDHISANSKDMVEKMGDIVWTINPENDSMERIIARLKAYAVNLCGGKGIQVHFEVDDGIKNFFPGMPDRKNIYLFCKEAINNAVKYSNGSNIFLSILKKNNKVAIEIKDDGKGFDTSSIVKGNGLINMQARAVELNAALDVFSKPGIGTSIKLDINFHPTGGQKELV